MSSKRFLMVPEDSSAARRPLPGVTMARATLLRSARFIIAFSRARFGAGSRRIPASQNRRFSGNSQESLALKVFGAEESLARKSGCLCDFRIKLALDVALGHLGGGQHLLDLAGLARGIELL